MSTEKLNSEKKGLTPVSLGINVVPMQTLRKRSSLKPKTSASLLVKSVRPLRPVLGNKAQVTQQEETK